MNDDRFYTIDTIRIPKRTTVCEWAQAHHYLKRTASYFRYDKYPFMVEPTNAMGDISTTWGVVIQCPSQTSKTTACMNFLGWMCEYDRQNTMVILDTANQAVNLSKNRLKPFLRDICHIHNDEQAITNPDKSNSSVNISLGTGANLILGSAKSASTLCSYPSKYVILDEIDRYPTALEGEGDPISLAMQRQMTYRGLTLFTSTPTTVEDSRIHKQWLLGTMEVWSVRCPSCGKLFSPTWKDIDWTDENVPTTHCPNCGELWTEADIICMEHAYAQLNDNPQTDKYRRILRSFSINGLLCHAQYTWHSLREYERAALQIGEAAVASFRNTRLGECYTSPTEIRIDHVELFRACGMRYDDSCIPEDIDFITVGIDTHETGLYMLIMGWTLDLQYAYGLSYHFLAGDPDEAAVWQQLVEQMNRKFVRADGVTLMPAFAFADVGGHRGNAVMTNSLLNPRLKPCKGFASSGNSTQIDPLVRRSFSMNFTNGIKGKCEIVEVGVTAGKDALLQMEKLTLAGEKHLAFNHKQCFDLAFFKSLTSEIRIGSRWVAPQKGAQYNEAMDCAVYSMACARYYYDNYYATGKDKEVVYRSQPKEQTEMKKKIEQDEAVEPKTIAKEKAKRGRKAKQEVEEIKNEKTAEKVLENSAEPKVEQPVKKFKHL